ncbi:hypothetical protein MNBD_GAMMA08-1119 [hydrothermal vent metagenome]|uniref:Uncharacterized protein n=1 Tax=hydrothermal vent metagenome TaxID=652676 RepID=A0A3B0XUW2_9ZZZZ
MKLTHLIFIFLLFAFQSTYAEVTKTVLPETHLIEWKLLDENLELKLIQRLPDQTRSFFEGRGFSKKITNNIAQSCVFQTITRNTSKAKDQTIHVALKNWSIKINNKTRAIKLKEDWDKEWTDNDVKPASRLAFRWATFPTEQSFEPSGDYNWGMISFGPKPGSQFDLYIEWKNNNKTKSVWIKNMTCPTNVLAN